MRKNKSAQAAIDFFKEYGWAILVVLIAIGALWYFGVLSPDGYRQTNELDFSRAENGSINLDNFNFIIETSCKEVLGYRFIIYDESIGTYCAPFSGSWNQARCCYK